MKSRQSPQAQNEAGAHAPQHALQARLLQSRGSDRGTRQQIRLPSFPDSGQTWNHRRGVLRIFHAAFRVYTVLRVSGELLPTLRVLKRVEHSAPWSVLEFPVACSECFVPSRIYTFLTAFPSLRQCRLRQLSRQRGEHLQVTREPHRAVCHGEDVEGKQ